MGRQSKVAFRKGMSLCMMINGGPLSRGRAFEPRTGLSIGGPVLILYLYHGGMRFCLGKLLSYSNDSITLL
jgi:hypothetical protein